MARKTALYDRHTALGARMVDFAGWLLPVQYPTGPLAEHLAVRRAAGLFDIDHMGQIEVTGQDALPFLQRMMTADLSTLGLWRAMYSLMCYPDGTIVDDVFIYRLPDRYMVAVNASNNAKDTRWMLLQRGALQVDVRNVSDALYMLALQGPSSASILQPICSADLGALGHHAATECSVTGVRCLLGRTGYAGEDGFELYFAAQDAHIVWDELLSHGAQDGLIPCGLAARDSLRLEPCLPLYGQEISAHVNPIEAGLSWAVSFEKTTFIGRGALLKSHLEGPARRLVAFQMVDRGVPRHGYPIVIGGAVQGEVTSGIYSPTLEAFVGMGYVPTGDSRPGTEIGISIRDQTKRARIVVKPFYVPAYRR